MKKKILLVEDNPALQVSVKMFLEKLGHEVAVAGDGWKCIELANQFQPDLMLLDVELPRLSGIGALEMMATHSLHRRIPIVMMTGQAEKNLVVKAIQLGAVDYIVKPFELKDLKARVDKYLASSPERKAQ